MHHLWLKIKHKKVRREKKLGKYKTTLNELEDVVKRRSSVNDNIEAFIFFADSSILSPPLLPKDPSLKALYQKLYKRALATLPNTLNQSALNPNPNPSHNTQLRPKLHLENISYNWIDINTQKSLNKVSIWLNLKCVLSFYKRRKVMKKHHLSNASKLRGQSYIEI